MRQFSIELNHFYQTKINQLKKLQSYPVEVFLFYKNEKEDEKTHPQSLIEILFFLRDKTTDKISNPINTKVNVYSSDISKALASRPAMNIFSRITSAKARDGQKVQNTPNKSDLENFSTKNTATKSDITNTVANIVPKNSERPIEKPIPIHETIIPKNAFNTFNIVLFIFVILL